MCVHGPMETAQPCGQPMEGDDSRCQGVGTLRTRGDAGVIRFLCVGPCHGGGARAAVACHCRTARGQAHGIRPMALSVLICIISGYLDIHAPRTVGFRFRNFNSIEFD